MVYEKILKQWTIDATGQIRKNIPQVQVIEGKKELTGKPEWSALPMDALVGVVRVLRKEN